MRGFREFLDEALDGYGQPIKSKRPEYFHKKRNPGSTTAIHFRRGEERGRIHHRNVGNAVRHGRWVVNRGDADYVEIHHGPNKNDRKLVA